MMKLLYAIAPLLLLVAYALDAWIKSRTFQDFSRRHGCQLPPRQSTSIFHKLRLLSEKYNNIFEEYYAVKFEKYGTTHAIIDRIKRPVVIHTIDPLNLRTVLVDSREDWLVFKGRRNALKPLAQDGVLTTDGALWHRNRTFLYGRVSSRRAKDTTSLEHDVALLFRAIENSAGGHNLWPVNLSPFVQRMTLDMSSQYLFGVSTDFQLDGIKRAKGEIPPSQDWQAIMESFVRNWDILRDYISKRAVLGSKYWLADGITYRRACARFRRFADMFVDKALQSATNNNQDRSQSALSLIPELMDGLRDAVKVREFVLELLIAGQNMTGSALEWTIAELAEHPDVYESLRKEILNTFGEGLDLNSSPFMTWDTLQSCQTLQNVIKETLRCHPVVSAMSRTAARDTVLPRGGGQDEDQPIAVPKGATITTNIYLLQRREEYWGSDATQWRPDRWIGKKIGPEYVAFGAGPRICLGRQMSLTQLSYVIARFVQHFESIRPAVGAKNLAYQYRSILSPLHGVQIVAAKSGGTLHHIDTRE